jgi:capsular polysaccharide export protein
LSCLYIRQPALTMGCVPFLRSPPFPRVPPAVSAISAPLDGGERPAKVCDTLLRRICDARVGGDFWGRRADGIRVVIGAHGAIDRLPGIDPEAIGVIPGGQCGEQGARRLPHMCDPWVLVEQAERVHADPAEDIALVAGLLDVPVIGRDGREVSGAVLRAALQSRIGGATYRNCFTGEEISIEDAVALLADWRSHFEKVGGLAAVSGMAWWKRDAITRFLWNGAKSPPFHSPRNGLKVARAKQGTLAIWPSRVPAALPEEAARQGVAVARVEDGFIRSRGLGAGLHPPGSVVVDRTGIYYDGGRPNDLETLLATHAFPPDLLERARRLRTRICASGVTKYGARGGAMIDLPAGRRTVLAVGQVDDDLSVRLGGAGVEGNLDFLTRVRRAEPDAWIIYRPHPDVQAGHRKGHIPDAVVLAYADLIDTGAPLMDLVQAVDAVHVLSSLTGFEALMRGCAVTVHGMPFYAGWGLTRDLAQAPARRGRPLDLDALVAAALLLYPLYLDPLTGLPCGPELLVDRLAQGSAPPVTALIRLRALQGKLRRFMTLSAEFLHG